MPTSLPGLCRVPLSDFIMNVDPIYYDTAPRSVLKSNGQTDNAEPDGQTADDPNIIADDDVPDPTPYRTALLNSLVDTRWDHSLPLI
jgi:hypothetical protein